MLRMLSRYDPLDVYYDLCDYRQRYDRTDFDEPKVRLTAEVRFASSEDFEEAKVKVIEIGPDPPLCVKRYIWGRRSKPYLSFYRSCVLIIKQCVILFQLMRGSLSTKLTLSFNSVQIQPKFVLKGLTDSNQTHVILYIFDLHS